MKTILWSVIFVVVAFSLEGAALFEQKSTAVERLQTQPKSRPSVSLYIEANFKGRLNRIKAPAEFPGSAALKKIDIANDGLLSMKIPAGVKVSVFDGDGFSGDSMIFTEGEHATLGKMANRVSSIKIELIENP